MKTTFLLFLFSLSFSGFSQVKKNSHPKKTIPAKVIFPTSFIGHWKGELEWYAAKKGTMQTVPMELHILPADTIGQYSWQMVYGAGGQDNRPYKLKAVDSAKGQWVIDELNGIVLNGTWLGERFSGAFAVMGNVIVDSYWLEKDGLHVIFFSYAQKPEKTTGNNTEESPNVEVYRIGSFQKAILQKQQ